jgi:hypothetical protein
MGTILDQCENVLFDGKERPIGHPSDEDRQKSCYSGKKTHNIKNTCFVLPISASYGFQELIKGIFTTRRLQMNNL